MKKIILVILAILIISSPFLVYAEDYPEEITEIKGQAAIAVDALSREILYSKNEHQQMYPASTTKMMTAILVLENCNLYEKVEINFESANTEGSSIYLQPGEQFTVEQMLYALLLQSANDVAEALACHVSGSVAEFGKLMTKRAKELGALNTNFVNPHGLPNKDHYTTAYDLSQIALHAITIPKLIEISSTARYEIPPTELYPQTRYLKNSNRFLWGEGGKHKFEYLGKKIDIMYPTILGIKTGYTKVAGNCLVSFAKKNNRKIISVVLKSSGNDLYRDSRYLVDYSIYNFESTKLISNNQAITKVPVKLGTTDKVGLCTQSDVYITKKIGENENIISSINIPSRITAPIKKGTVIGEIILTKNGGVINRVPLVTMKAVASFQVWRVLGWSLILIIAFAVLKKWSISKYKQLL